MTPLEKYLQENGSLVIYRIVEEDVEEEYEDTIENVAEETGVEKEVVEEAYYAARDEIFDDKNSDYVMAHTDPQPYLTITETSIVDICSIGETEEDAEEALAEAKEASNQRKEELLKYREEEVKPFLNKMKKDLNVRYLAFRGDLEFEGRWTTPFSDINVVVKAEEDAETLREYLKDGPGTIEVLDKISEKTVDEIIKERDAPIVSYDIWTPESYMERKQATKMEKGTYMYRYFKEVEVFYQE